MAKISSPWVGAAGGKLGEGVYYRSNGQQLARAKAASVKNPKSVAQMMTRIALATASRAYSALKPLADHSFQNYAYGQRNQQRFMKLAVAALRGKVSEAGVIARLNMYNFNKKDDFGAVINDYTISEGNLPVVPVNVDPNVDASVDIAGFTTYQSVCDALGLPAGAQLTFVVLSSDATEETGGKSTGVHYARVILMPSDGDMSKNFLGTNGLINDPNPKNEGLVTFPESADGLAFIVDRIQAKNVGAAAVIASAYEDGKWRRSTQKFVLRANVTAEGNEAYYDSETYGYALDSYMPSASTSESDKYLNEGE